MYAHFHASASCHATCLGQGQEDGASPQDCRFGGPSLFRSSALQVLIYARTCANNEDRIRSLDVRVCLCLCACWKCTHTRAPHNTPGCTRTCTHLISVTHTHTHTHSLTHSHSLTRTHTQVHLRQLSEPDWRQQVSGRPGMTVVALPVPFLPFLLSSNQTSYLLAAARAARHH